MDWLLKLLGWGIALSGLFAELKAVKAKAPETTVADYNEAAAAVLATPDTATWLAKIEQKYGAAKAEAIRTELPFVLWAIDYATER